MIEAGLKTHRVGAALCLALVLGLLTAIAPTAAVLLVGALVLSALALLDLSLLIGATMTLHMVGERTGISNRALSVSGFNVFPNDLLTLGLLFGLGVRWLRSGRVPALRRDAVFLSLWAFLAYGLFSMVRSLPIVGWSAVLAFRLQFFYGLLFVLTYEALETVTSRRRLLYALLFSAVVVGLQGLYNVATGTPVGAMTGSRTTRYLSGIQAMVLFFALAFITGTVWIRRRPGWSLALGALFVSGILLSQARSVWLGALIAVAVIVLATSDWKRLGKRLVAPTVALVLAIVWAGANLQRLPVVGDVYRRLTSFQKLEEDPTAIWRLVVWGEALLALRASPFLGLGLGKRFVYFDTVRGDWDRDSQLHNSYLELAYYTGAIGAGLLILFQVLVLRTTLLAATRARGTPKAGVLLALAACQICLAAVAFTNVIGASMAATTFSWVLAAVAMREVEYSRGSKSLDV